MVQIQGYKVNKLHMENTVANGTELQLQNQVTECAMLTLQQETTSKKKDSENTSHTEQDILSDCKITSSVMYHLLTQISSKLDSASQ